MSQRLKLGEIVLRAGVIDQLQLDSALGEQKKWGGRLGLTLIKLGYVSESDLANAVASQLNLPVARLDGKKIPRRILDLVPYDFADDHTCLPLFLKNEEGVDTLYVGMDDPSNLAILDDLAFRTGMRVKPVVVAASEICEGIDRFYRDLEQDATRGREKTTETLDPPSSWDSSSYENEETAAPAPPSPADQEKSNDASTRMLLQALAQVLIEKGVVTREEFYHRVRALGDEAALEGPAEPEDGAQDSARN